MHHSFKHILWMLAGMTLSGHAFAAKCDSALTANGVTSAIKAPVAYAVTDLMKEKSICKMDGARNEYDRMLKTQYFVVPEASNQVESDMHAITGSLIKSKNFLAAQEIARANYLSTKGKLAQMDVLFISNALKPTMEDAAYADLLKFMQIKLNAYELTPAWRNAFTLAGYSIVYDDNIGLAVAKGMIEKSSDKNIQAKYKAFIADISKANQKMKAAYANESAHEH